MKKYSCEMCGKQVMQVQDHHVIPWYLSHDDSESNVMRLCPSCHKKADISFDNLILRGRMRNLAGETLKRTATRYTKKYLCRKILSRFKVLKDTFYEDILHYNKKTGSISIFQSWRYLPNKYRYRDRSIKSRACLNNAASAKGQATLSGGY